MLPFQAKSSLEKPQKRAFATLAVYVTVIGDKLQVHLKKTKLQPVKLLKKKT